jgi:hypothetical protein
VAAVLGPEEALALEAGDAVVLVCAVGVAEVQAATGSNITRSPARQRTA